MTLLHQAAQKAVEAPSVLDVGFKYANGVHTPTVLLAFRDWDERDAFVSALQHQEEPPVHIDVERMNRALRGPRILIPDGLSVEGVVAFINGHADSMAEQDQQQQVPRPDHESLVEAIATHIDGWRSATFGWQGDPDPSIEARNREDAVQGHAAECLRRIHATLAASPSTTRQQEVGSGYEFAGGFLQDKRVDGSTRWNQVSKQYENDVDVVKLYRAAAPSPLQQEVRSGWRPIATAPKDGREIILREGSRVGAACWVEWPDTHDNDGAPKSDGGEGWTVGYDGNEWRNPTAWQPLPAAPSTPEKAGGVMEDGNAEG